MNIPFPDPEDTLGAGEPADKPFAFGPIPEGERVSQSALADFMDEKFAPLVRPDGGIALALEGLSPYIHFTPAQRNHILDAASPTAIASFRRDFQPSNILKTPLFDPISKAASLGSIDFYDQEKCAGFMAVVMVQLDNIRFFASQQIKRPYEAEKVPDLLSGLDQQLSIIEKDLLPEFAQRAAEKLGVEAADLINQANTIALNLEENPVSGFDYLLPILKHDWPKPEGQTGSAMDAEP